MTIQVADYDPKWEADFLSISEPLLRALEPLSVRFEHVGSTSVPGLAAKPVIDLDVIVARENVPEVIEMLGKIGYRHRGDLGIEDREAFFQPSEILIKHHLYVCVEGTTSLRNHLTLRDWLRTNPRDRERYGELKKQLASEFPGDIESYCAGKTSFITAILERSGFDSSELSSIELANQPGKGPEGSDD